MSNTSTDRTEESFFGEVISTYTRAQAIEDGVLVDAGSMPTEAGFSCSDICCLGRLCRLDRQRQSEKSFPGSVREAL